MKRFLLWSFDRGSLQYDVICGLILGFIFLTPAVAFKDRPDYMRIFAHDPEVRMTIENGMKVYTVKLKNSAVWDDDANRGLALDALTRYVKKPIIPAKPMKPIYTTTGMTIGYAVWLEETK